MLPVSVTVFTFLVEVGGEGDGRNGMGRGKEEQGGIIVGMHKKALE